MSSRQYKKLLQIREKEKAAEEKLARKEEKQRRKAERIANGEADAVTSEDEDAPAGGSDSDAAVERATKAGADLIQQPTKRRGFAFEQSDSESSSESEDSGSDEKDEKAEEEQDGQGEAVDGGDAAEGGSSSDDASENDAKTHSKRAKLKRALHGEGKSGKKTAAGTSGTSGSKKDRFLRRKKGDLEEEEEEEEEEEDDEDDWAALEEAEKHAEAERERRGNLGEDGEGSLPSARTRQQDMTNCVERGEDGSLATRLEGYPFFSSWRKWGGGAEATRKIVE